MDAFPAVAAWVQEEAAKLDKYFDRITSCRVIVEAPHRHHRRGEPFQIRIELGVPAKNSSSGMSPRLNTNSKGSGTSTWKRLVRTRMCMWRFATHSKRCGGSCRTMCAVYVTM